MYVLVVLIAEVVTDPGASRQLIAGHLFAVALINLILGVSVSRWDLSADAQRIAQRHHPNTLFRIQKPDSLESAGEQIAGLPSGPPLPNAGNPAQDRIIERLRHAMGQERLYRRERLTIASLATEIGTSEHRLRTAVNRRLGYRNFNELLHDYRLAEASERLRDMDQAHIPVLTIALEVGYASIGPFNRAFKARYNQTPTAYRGEQLGDHSNRDR